MISKLLSAMPREFDFYGMGQVRLQEAALLPQPGPFLVVSEDMVRAVAYSFQGDATGVLILTIPGGADLSMYSEMGNVIASKIANELSARDGLDVMISPPRPLSSAALRTLLTGSGELEGRTYLHHSGRDAVTLSAYLLPLSSANSMEGIGNA